ncbi:pyrroline-5-carboxylate reductase [Haematococcus lacustris]|uniref:Pyrroline-5-carboxylate reductase n=1 Tax=Haematococcus lacustris TaxID=44745 RepID=A0A699Z797_HAELA|nr:pyrroline-5-carboxylate reductase [Haematococcus lacustris]
MTFYCIPVRWSYHSGHNCKLATLGPHCWRAARALAWAKILVQRCPCDTAAVYQHQWIHSNAIDAPFNPSIRQILSRSPSPRGRHLTPHLVRSCSPAAAGVTVDKLVDAAGPHARVVRVMPNTPCLVGETAAAMCLGGKADASDEQLVRQLFEAVGKIYTVDEKLLAAVTGLSGSGPAYVFMMVEALADGGVKAGLPREIAQALAAQTVLGSAKMVLETGKHPGALKDMVTSPGGTTIAGVHELEKAGVRAAFMSAVVAATNRANELSSM